MKRDAPVVAMIGARGSGKTASVIQVLQVIKPKRLMVWDAAPVSQYSKFGLVVSSLKNLVRAMEAAQGGDVALVYCPVRTSEPQLIAQFNLFCELAMHPKIGGNLVLVGEELADVTKAGYAPQNWRYLVTQGRHTHCAVFGITQRPALVDKTFLNNASRIRCFRLNTASDKKTMADNMDVPFDQIAALKKLEYVEKDCDTGKIFTGKLKF